MLAEIVLIASTSGAPVAVAEPAVPARLVIAGHRIERIAVVLPDMNYDGSATGLTPRAETEAALTTSAVEALRRRNFAPDAIATVADSVLLLGPALRFDAARVSAIAAQSGTDAVLLMRYGASRRAQVGALAARTRVPPARLDALLVDATGRVLWRGGAYGELSTTAETADLGARTLESLPRPKGSTEEPPPVASAAALAPQILPLPVVTRSWTHGAEMAFSMGTGRHTGPEGNISTYWFPTYESRAVNGRITYFAGQREHENWNVTLEGAFVDEIPHGSGTCDPISPWGCGSEPDGRRSLTVVQLRAGGEGRYGGAELGFVVLERRGFEPTYLAVSKEPNPALIPAGAFWVGTRPIHVWVELGTGAVHNFDGYPLGIGLGHRGQYANVRAGITEYGAMLQGDVPVGPIRLGADLRYEDDEKWSALGRVVVPFGNR